MRPLFAALPTRPVLLPLALALAACAMPYRPDASSEPIPFADGDVIDWLRATLGPDGRYRAGEADLDGDGVAELLVHNVSPNSCGSGGCTLSVLRNTAGGVVELDRQTIVRLPVRVLAETSQGWKNLEVGRAGGGVAARREVLRYDGTRYRAAPSLAPAGPDDAEAVTVITAGDPRPIVD